VLNIGLARSAIGRPYSGYHRSIHRKAAALVHSLAKNHAFVDGNKRTALYVMHLRLIRSGYRLRGEDNPALQNELEDMILDVATGQMDFEALVQWFEDRIVRVTRTLESG
jgi:death on curing protein